MENRSGLRTGRVVVITGAAGGIGTALVDRFLMNDDMVVATDRDETALARVGDVAGTAIDRLSMQAGDISSDDDCAALARIAQARFGRVDVLINCAGHFPHSPFDEISATQWRRVVEINLTGVFLMVQAMLPLLKGRGWGRIISFGSGTFFRGSPNQAHYVAAKAGVIGLSRCLATELGSHGITSNVITPGLTLTEPVLRAFPAEQLAMRRVERALQRDMYAEDLVGATFFLASPDADCMTGQIVNVDGGNFKH